MNPIDIDLFCPKCLNFIANLNISNSAFEHKCTQCNTAYGNLCGVPNMMVFQEKDENRNLLHNSKLLPKQNSNYLQIPFIIEALNSREKVLELGAGFDSANNANLIKTDAYLYSTELHCLADAHKLPFEDNSFGYVYSLAVFEHLHSPWIAANEIYRVLKPGGKVFTLTAFMQHMHGYPHHYFNMTTYGLRRIFKSFNILKCEASIHSSINEIAYILCDLNFVLNQQLKDTPICKNELQNVNKSVDLFCRNIGKLNNQLHNSKDLNLMDYSKIAPAIEIIAEKPDY